MCISTIGDVYRGVSIYPFVQADELRDKIVDEANDSLAIKVQSRLLFIAQIICSIVALLLTPLATIIVPSIVLFVEGKEDSWEEMKKMGLWEVVLLATIPTALVAAFAPHEKKWMEPAEKVVAWRESCLEN